MNEWIEIFKAGNYGEKGNYTEDDLDQVINRFESETAGVPITLDHIKTGPAYGWVDKLKREGKSLFASFKEVPIEFWNTIVKGYFKNRSVELSQTDNKGLRLRAVTFLGAMTPEIKDLKDIGFGDEPYTIIEFSDFKSSEDDIDKLKDELLELKKLFKSQLDNGERNFSKDKNFAELNNYRQKEIETFCDDLVDRGKIMLYSRDKVKAIFSALREYNKVIEFSENVMGHELVVKKESILDTFKDLLNANPGHDLFKELIPDGRPDSKIYNFSSDSNAESNMRMAKVERIAKERGLRPDDAEGRYAIINELYAKKEV